jgi:HAD superfamily hydrolase (TIGR01549 family)
MMPLEISTIVFDFDGVLVESVSAKGEAFQALYADDGPEIQQQVLDYHLANGGVSRFDKIRYFENELMGRAVDEEAVVTIADRFGALVEEKVIRSDWVAGAEAFLKSAKGRAAIYVASATPQKELERIIKKREMTDYFDGIYGSPMKKAEHISNLIASEGMEPSDMVMVGDTMSDLSAAQSTGIHFIGRLESKRNNPFPEGVAVIDDLTGLPDLIRF